MKPINLAQKLHQFSTHRGPHVMGDYNDNDLMVVRFERTFPFHLHENTNDFFLVMEGEMEMDLEDTTQTLRAGDLFIVPNGVIKRPRASRECKVLLIEPKGEPNTRDPATAASKPRI